MTDAQLKAAQRAQELRINLVCVYCTCATLAAITKESVRDDHVWRCSWCGKVNEPTLSTVTDNTDIHL